MMLLLAVATLKLAVLNLQATGVEPAVAQNLSEALVAEVAQQECCSVISTSDIQAMLGFERQKQMLSCTDDSSCLAELGGSLGASKLIVGSIGKLDDTLLLNLKLIDTAKGVVENRTSDAVEGKAAQLLAVIKRRVPELLAKYVSNAPKPVAAAALKPLENASPATPATPAAAASSRSTSKLGLGAGVGAVVFAVMGGVMQSKSNASYDRYKAAIEPADITGARADTQSQQRLATGSFAIAGVAAAVGVGAFVFDF